MAIKGLAELDRGPDEPGDAEALRVRMMPSGVMAETGLDHHGTCGRLDGMGNPMVNGGEIVKKKLVVLIGTSYFKMKDHSPPSP